MKTMKTTLIILLSLSMSMFIGCTNQQNSKPLQITKSYDLDGNFRGTTPIDSIVINDKTKTVDYWYQNKILHKWIIKDTIFPSYKGGDTMLFNYMDGFTYPKSAIKSGVQGKIFVEFVVENDGSISNVKLLKGIQKDCDDVAIKMITNMPTWNPAYINGNPLKFKLVFPIQLKLN
jgi:TonB family protein